MQNLNGMGKVKELLQDFVCFVEKYFMYFFVFGTTKNNKNKKYFRFSRKRLFNFCKRFSLFTIRKMIFIFKIINYFSSLNILFLNW